LSKDFSDSIIVTGCDENHFALAEDLALSIHERKSRPYALGFVNMSSTGQKFAAADVFDFCVDAPGARSADLVDIKGFKIAYLNVKALLPDMFPGYRRYMWVDADCWIQNEIGLMQVLDACRGKDLAIHPESDIHYTSHKTPANRNMMVYRQIFGGADDQDKRDLMRFPMVNAGVFGATAQSPLWKRWTGLMDEIRERPDPERNKFYCDQVPLHYLIFSKQLSFFPLRSINNWQTWACNPDFDIRRKRLVLPTPPCEEINIMHLAGHTKDIEFNFGEIGSTSLRYRHFKKFVTNAVENEKTPKQHSSAILD
jgi:hypothetical protein